MIVKPVNPAVNVPYPMSQRTLPPEGAEVPDDIYWRRRILAGEVVRVVESSGATPSGLEPVAPLVTR